MFVAPLIPPIPAATSVSFRSLAKRCMERRRGVGGGTHIRGVGDGEHARLPRRRAASQGHERGGVIGDEANAVGVLEANVRQEQTNADGGGCGAGGGGAR
jgi:hypothetical protein